LWRGRPAAPAGRGVNGPREGVVAAELDPVGDVRRRERLQTVGEGATDVGILKDRDRETKRVVELAGRRRRDKIVMSLLNQVTPKRARSFQTGCSKP